MSDMKGKRGLNPRLDMTPMIDVVFQLLIFFVIAIKQEDILSQLTAARPSKPPPGPAINLLNLDISSSGFELNGKSLSRDQLDHRLGQYSRLSKTAMVTLTCSIDSPHGLLVQSLDLCNKHGMKNISIFSRK
jgi:biopolymer transport protein ExbD